MTAKKDPLLVLHFDVNKTIVLEDKAANKSTQQLLSGALAEQTWGFMDTSCSPITWRRDEDIDGPQLLPPSPQHCNYVDYVEALFPRPPRDDGESAEAYNERLSATMKADRTAIVSRFTEEGQPGHHLLPLMKRMQSKLTYANARGQRVHHFILPSFWTLIADLIERQRRFAIVFRTFGDDLPDVVREWNDFVMGRHVLFSYVHAPELLFHETQSGFSHCFYRNGLTADDLHLVCGTFEAPKEHSLGLQWYKDNFHVCDSDDDDADDGVDAGAVGDAIATAKATDADEPRRPVRIVSGATNIHQYMSRTIRHHLSQCEIRRRSAAAAAGDGSPHDCSSEDDDDEEMIARGAVLACRDYYPMWGASGEHCTAGKLLIVEDHVHGFHPVPPADAPAPSEEHHIFFDDNVFPHAEPDACNILDVRCSKGKSIPVASVYGRHVVKSNPIVALLDANYFIRSVAECEDARLSHLRKHGRV